MQMAPHITAIQTDLAAAAALGDEATAEAARRVSEALGTSLHLRLLDLLGEAALDVNGQLPSGHVEVRLVGREPELVFVAEPDDAIEPAPTGDDQSARITLRLSKRLGFLSNGADRRQACVGEDGVGRVRGGCREFGAGDPLDLGVHAPCASAARANSNHEHAPALVT